jgi:membrane-bound lytic murein transglycosylase A
MRHTILLLATAALSACASPEPVAPVIPYNRPLPPGGSALRLITEPGRLPDLERGFAGSDALVLEAIDHSLKWFEAPSSRRAFPFEGISHERARRSLEVMSELLAGSPDGATFAAEVRRRFDVYESVGYDGSGVVLYTGYFSPIFQASPERTDRFNVPLYRRPEDLVTDPVSGRPLGRRLADGSTVPYPPRREIESSGMLAGSELVWLENALDAYLVHVNGSAKLRMPDGSVRFVGYAGKTDRPYASLGKAMVEAGLLQQGRVNLSGIRAAFRREPQRVAELMHRNENYVFFTDYPEGRWPSGSLGARVTAETTLATDKEVYPRGGLVLVDTTALTFTGASRAFFRFMLDQDTGGAIDAPGRADIFMGIGQSAEILAGGQYAEGRLYYFFLKESEMDSVRTVAR